MCFSTTLWWPCMCRAAAYRSSFTSGGSAAAPESGPDTPHRHLQVLIIILSPLAAISFDLLSLNQNQFQRGTNLLPSSFIFSADHCEKILGRTSLPCTFWENYSKLFQVAGNYTSGLYKITLCVWADISNQGSSFLFWAEICVIVKVKSWWGANEQSHWRLVKVKCKMLNVKC